MKICVFSDSHGYAGNMTAAIELERPEICFFLGDGDRDIAAIEKQYPDLSFYIVRGNCDMRSKAPYDIVCDADGVTIFAAHGHMHSVKYEPSLDTLTARALREGADIALFGHTHRQYMAVNNSVTLINPGSIGQSLYPCYAVIETRRGFFNADLKAI